MPFAKHDSMVVSEIVSAFGVVALFSISTMLFLMYGEMRNENRQMNKNSFVEETAKKISIQDLDPALLSEINNSFGQLGASQQNSNQQIGFFMGKLLEKSFTEQEITAMQAELTEIQKQQMEAAKAEQAKQGQGGQQNQQGQGQQGEKAQQGQNQGALESVPAQ